MMIFLLFSTAEAGWKEMLDSLLEAPAKTQTGGSVMEEKAIRLALEQGVSYAVDTLGKENGYFNDIKARIGLPDNVQPIAEFVKKSGGEAYVDDLILSMNTAATQAAPKTVEIFFSSIKRMKIDDAKQILSAKEDALSQYFKKDAYEELDKAIYPIVQEMMEKNSVSKYYKKVRSSYDNSGLGEQLGNLGKSLGLQSYAPPKDLDVYVTKKAIEGLFIKISEEEKKIREHPMVQKSQIIRDVFGQL